MKRLEYLKKLTKMSIKELVAQRNKLRKELHELRMKNSVKGLKETHKIGEHRIRIAQISTVLKSKVKENNGDNRE